MGIESVLQKGKGVAQRSVPVIVVTHVASEKAVRAALLEIDRWPSVTGATCLIRIEEEV